MTFWDKELDETLSTLSTTEDGLSSQEAKSRLLRNGKNKLREGHKKSNFAKFIDQFKDLMIIILIIAAVFSGISSYANHEPYTDTIIIVLVVFLNAMMGFVQELKAESAVESLRKMTSTTARVKRDRITQVVNTEDIVIGDILELEAGDRVPADARVIWEVQSSIDESMLTGESEMVQKDVARIGSNTALNERTNMIYSGCNVVYGKLIAVVTATGMDTELGKIASTIQKDKDVLSPLQIKINNVSKVLSGLIGIIIAAILVYSIYVGNDLLESIMLCISLAVAAIPEGLPAVITIALSLGTTSMAKKNTIVRKISSVETLGSVDVICSDKTGTITQNRMTVREVIFNNRHFDVDKEPIENSELIINMMVLCNNTEVDQENGGELIGDPTETALFKYATDRGYNPLQIVKEHVRITEAPFDSDRKMMTTVNEINGKKVAITKGGNDALLDRCTSYNINGNVRPLTEQDRKTIKRFEKEMADKSLRVLSFAYKVVDYVPEDENELLSLENDLIFVGMVGMMDPPRATVKESIRRCKEAGIRPVMITGDSLTTASAIAKDIGILEEGQLAIEGKDLDKMTDYELMEKIDQFSVYARVQPEHKVRIVKAWQSRNKVVAMTGDGVNDAPAIKLSHVGIGMGKTGTEVTKSVADVVLVDDSFSTIVDAVEEGRKIYDNIRNDIIYSLSSNFAEMIIVIIGLLMKVNIFLPIHILYVDLATDSIPSICLAFEKAEKGIMKRKPKPVNKPFFTPFIIANLAISAIIEAAICLGVYIFANNNFGAEVAQTMAFLCLIVQEITYGINCRNLKEPVAKQGLFSNKAMNWGILGLILLQILVFATPIRNILKITPLTLTQVGIIVGVNIVAFLIIELSKFVTRKFFRD